MSSIRFILSIIATFIINITTDIFITVIFVVITIFTITIFTIIINTITVFHSCIFYCFFWYYFYDSYTHCNCFCSGLFCFDNYLVDCTGSLILSSIKYVRKIIRKTNISKALIRTRTRAYQGVRNVSFSENFAYVLNGWPLALF